MPGASLKQWEIQRRTINVKGGLVPGCLKVIINHNNGVKMTLQDLLKMKVKVGDRDDCSPDFRVAVQQVDGPGGSTHVIIHADSHDSETIDLWVRGDRVYRNPDPVYEDIQESGGIAL
jgi:hypothetical protein